RALQPRGRAGAGAAGRVRGVAPGGDTARRRARTRVAAVVRGPRPRGPQGMSPRSARRSPRSAPAAAPAPGAAPRAPWVTPELIPVLAAGAALWIWFQIGTRIRLEDALITGRFAENLARGNGWVFNAGERVLGTTSPLHTLLIAGLAKAFGVEHIAIIAIAIGIAGGVAALVFLHAALRAADVPNWPALLATLLFAVSADMMWFSTAGLETPLVLAFMTMGLNAVVRGRWMEAGVSAGLLLLTRIDGLVWAGVMLIAVVAALRVRAWKPIALAVAIVLPLVVFATSYFGSPIPGAVVAKQAINPGSGLVRYWAWLANALGMDFQNAADPIPFALWFPLVVLGALTVFARPPRRLWMVAAFPPLFCTALGVLHAPWFPWYMVPTVWCGIVMAVVGGEALLTALFAQAEAGHWSRWTLRIGMLLVAALIGYGIVRQDLGVFHDQRDFQDNENTTRRAIGEWLRTHTAPNAVVAMEAIGYQGTFSERRVVDLAGIVTPEVVRMRKESGSNAGTF